jgi:hypothetical protein
MAQVSWQNCDGIPTRFNWVLSPERVVLYPITHLMSGRSVTPFVTVSTVGLDGYGEPVPVQDNALLGFGAADLNRAIDLILSTKHDREKNIVTDVDLAGLGFKPEIYDECSIRIRLEYSDFSDDEWKAGRSASLARLLASERIFVTPDFLQFEAPARENMRRELNDLTLK